MKTRYLLLSAVVSLCGMTYGGALDAGWAAYNQGDYEKAYDLFSDVFREDPANVDANYALGEAAYKKKKYSHAIFAYERVLMVEPGHAKALLGKARAEEALGQTQEALNTYAQVLSATSDKSIRSQAVAGQKSARGTIPRISTSVSISLAGVYDDNINYGSDNNIFPAVPSKETAGMEGRLNVLTTYDAGAMNNWMAVGGVNLFNSWYDVAPEQELADMRLFAGARKVGTKSLLEMVGRAERLWYGHAPLVDLYAGDFAYLRSISAVDWLTTSMSLEFRDFDADFDPFGDRDSIYVVAGESWKHYMKNTKNHFGLGADALYEQADSDFNSFMGYRVRLDGQMELPSSVVGYAGGRYRVAYYDDPLFAGIDEREDTRMDFFIGAKKQLTESLQIDLKYLYVKNDSNNTTYEYERNRVNLTATYEF
ncbi:MAG: tetratricopeptide repeat protein [Pontiellaceae bacterium]|nr:tetratricopeptide repeat protein [Pontiellaceae bacterium]MBN2784617.1 tetratricopeptide repeat protein [Pontiellaceae bacterium]